MGAGASSGQEIVIGAKNSNGSIVSKNAQCLIGPQNANGISVSNNVQCLMFPVSPAMSVKSSPTPPEPLSPLSPGKALVTCKAFLALEESLLQGPASKSLRARSAKSAQTVPEPLSPVSPGKAQGQRKMPAKSAQTTPEPLSPLSPAKVMRRLKKTLWEKPDPVVVRLPQKPLLRATPNSGQPIAEGCSMAIFIDEEGAGLTRQLSPVSACWRSSSQRLRKTKAAELARKDKIVQALAKSASSLIDSNPCVAAGLAMVAADVAEGMPVCREESKSLLAWEATASSNRIGTFASKALEAAKKGSWQAEELIDSAITSAVLVSTARRCGVNVKRI